MRFGLLRIFYSLDFDILFQKMAFVMDGAWDCPFDPPTVIFPDGKVEQWFKINWMRKNGGRVLMNMKSDRIENFLYSTLASSLEPGERWYDVLEAEFLRNRIMTKLVSDGGGMKYYENPVFSAVRRYITDESGNVDIVRLYDFSYSMADIFLEYENSRSTEFVSAWRNGKRFFESEDENVSSDEDVFSDENWQMKLYRDCVGDCDKAGKISLAVLADKIFSDGKKIGKSNRKIIIFGFSGMGQLYRNLLKKISEESGMEISVFIQAAGSESVSEKNGNPLLEKWGEEGRLNLSLFAENPGGSENIVCERVSAVSESKNETLQKEKCDSKTVLQVVKEKIESGDGNPVARSLDSSLSVSRCASRFREIEDVHSKICSIIAIANANANSNADSDSESVVKYSDFLVVAPDIEKYRVPILQVFSSGGDGFPRIPCVIADYSSANSSTAEALEILLSVLEKDSLRRADFFSLLRNPVVQSARGITDEDVAAFSAWASSMNAFRDRNDGENEVEEWKDAAKRMLLSRLTDRAVGEYLPFSDIESADGDRLFKFVDAIDSLEDFRKSFSLSRNEDFDSEKMTEFSKKIEGLIKVSDNDDDDKNKELSGERNVFAKIRAEINRQRRTSNAFGVKMNSRGFFFALLDSASSASGNSSESLTGGVTFRSLNPNCIVGAKHVFFIGMDSSSFPGIDRESECDLRKRSGCSVVGDESVVRRNKNAFLCSLMAAKKSFHASYVHRDLKKDEDFYRAQVLNDLFSFVLGSSSKIEDAEKELSIDEKRGWSELFTKRGFRNKRNFLRLSDSSLEDSEEEKTLSPANESSELPEKVSVWQLKQFLTDPFVFGASGIMNTDEDDSFEETFEFEPVALNALEKSFALKKLVWSILEKTDSDSERNSKNPAEKIESMVEKLSGEMKSMNILPDGVFGKVAFSDVTECGKSVASLVLSDCASLPFNFDCNTELSLETKSGNRWRLSARHQPFAWSENENGQKKLTIIDIIDVSNSKKISLDKFLSPYLSALSLIAKNKIENCEVLMKIYHPSEKNPAFATGDSKKFELDFAKAESLLNEMYSLAFEKKYRKCVPLELFEKEIDSLYALKDELLGQYGAWQYFPKKYMFDVFKDIGFSFDDFEKSDEEMSVWDRNVVQQSHLVESILKK